ncbi:MAG: hypothetical protein FJ119_12465 [Deltaproteobacteria bacterium]|nr:hypothetical protein [Deltaproteobacteria bacterium]
MEQKEVLQLISEYLGLLKRGKFIVLIPLCICVFLGAAIAFKLPKAYRSEAKMFYMQQQIPDWAKLETANIYLEAMLIFIEALALSPDNILKLINELDLYPELEGKVASSDMIDHFTKSYSLQYDYTEIPTKYGTSEEILTGFTFSFDHNDGRKAYYVANALATSFIELFRKFREGTSVRSSTFFEAERERLRREMAVIDQQVATFKEKHVNELPELFALNYRMVEVTTNKIFTIDQKMMELRGQQRNLEMELSTMSPVLGMTGLSGERIVTPQERLAALKSELGQLRARYSDRHPDVIRAQHEIGKLEALVAGQTQNSGHNDEQASEGRGAMDRYVVEQSGGAFNPLYTQLKVRLEEVKIELQNLQLERVQHEADLVEYERRVGLMPFVEKEWLILARDRDSAQQRFNDLASQVLTMESSAEMEKRELGGRLSIGQPPVIPLQPFKPNIPMIIGVAFFVGLSIGVGLLLGWDYTTKTIRTSQDLMPLGEASLLVELPMVATEGKAASFKLNMVFVRVAVVVLLIGMVVAVDLFYMKVDILIVKLISLVQTKLALTGL